MPLSWHLPPPPPPLLTSLSPVSGWLSLRAGLGPRDPAPRAGGEGPPGPQPHQLPPSPARGQARPTDILPEPTLTVDRGGRRSHDSALSGQSGWRWGRRWGRSWRRSRSSPRGREAASGAPRESGFPGRRLRSLLFIFHLLGSKTTSLAGWLRPSRGSSFHLTSLIRARLSSFDLRRLCGGGPSGSRRLGRRRRLRRPCVISA